MSSRASVRPQFSQSIGLGIGAYLVGYLFTYIWKGQYAASIAKDAVLRFQATGQDAFVGETNLAFLLVDSGVNDTTWAGWLFYNAHFVPVSAGNFPNSTPTFVPNLLLIAREPLYLLLILVPPLTLCLAGFLIARSTSRGGTTVSVSSGMNLSSSTVRGMSITMGYLPCVLIGAVVFSTTPVDQRVAMLAPEFLLSLLVAGMLYPVVFGGIGGWIAMKRFGASRRTAAST